MPKAAVRKAAAEEESEEEESEEEADFLPDAYNAESVVNAKGKGKACRYWYAAALNSLTC